MKLNIALKREVKELFKDGVEKERIFMLALCLGGEEDDFSSQKDFFLDLCRLEDKIYFNYRVEMDDIMQSEEFLEICREEGIPGFTLIDESFVYDDWTEQAA